MFSRYKKIIENTSKFSKTFSFTPRRSIKVTVLGAAGKIGQSLGLLLKQHKSITNLSLFDRKDIVEGVGLDLSHINSRCVVDSYNGSKNIGAALHGAKIVIVTAGKCCNKHCSYKGLFRENRSIVSDLMSKVGTFAPTAIVLMVTEPIESMVPLASEVMIKSGVYNPARIIGVTTVDVIRASTIAACWLGSDVTATNVPVIGGHTPETMIPVLSQACPSMMNYFSPSQLQDIVTKIRAAHDEVMRADNDGKAGAFSIAFAVARFTNSLLRGMEGLSDAVECAFVKSSVTDTSYFASPVVLGRNGVKRNLGVGVLNIYERNLLEAATPDIQRHIYLGADYVIRENSSTITQEED